MHDGLPAGLLVADRFEVRLASALRRRGYRVRWAPTPDAAIVAIRERSTRPDALIVGALSGGGPTLLRRLRGGEGGPAGRRVPVLVVVRSRRAAQVALKASADAVLVGDRRDAELSARVHALLRRTGSTGYGRVALDTTRRRAVIDGRELVLTRCEFELLAALAAAPRTLTKAELIQLVGLGRTANGLRAVNRAVLSLRRELGPAGPRLVTVWGVGYRLNWGPAPTN